MNVFILLQRYHVHQLKVLFFLQDHNNNPLGIAATIAHEMGHNLGMSHDTSNCDCGKTQPGQNCIMGESIG